MTPDDIRVLVETEDENNRRGNFTRIFPSPNGKQYLKYFETNRYYNILTIEWMLRHKSNPEKGTELKLAMLAIHLRVELFDCFFF